MYCAKCKCHYDDDSLFCVNCGGKLISEAAIDTEKPADADNKYEEPEGMQFKFPEDTDTEPADADNKYEEPEGMQFKFPEDTDTEPAEADNKFEEPEGMQFKLPEDTDTEPAEADNKFEEPEEMQFKLPEDTDTEPAEADNKFEESENTQVPAPEPADTDTREYVTEEQSPRNGSEDPEKQNTDPEKKDDKPFEIPSGMIKLIAGVAAAFVLIIAVFLVVNGIKKARYVLNIVDYVHVEQSGCDGFGNISAWFDREAMLAKVLEFNGLEDTVDEYGNALYGNGKSYYKTVDMIGCFDQMYGYSLEMEMPDANGRFKNGDVVIINVIYHGEEKNKELGCKIRGGEFTYTVEGLDDPEVLDWLSEEHLSIEFYGRDGFGRCDTSITNNTDYYTPEYKIDKQENLSNGDVVTISYAYDDEQYGYLLTQATNDGLYFKQKGEKKFTVEGLQRFVKSPGEIDDGCAADFDKQSRNYIKDMIDDWNDPSTAGECKYVGYYFMYSDSESARTVNKYYRVYGIPVSPKVEEDEENRDFIFYYAVSFSNLSYVEDEEGAYEIGYTEDSVSGTNNSFRQDNLTYRGFKTLDEMKEQLDKEANGYTAETDLNNIF